MNIGLKPIGLPDGAMIQLILYGTAGCHLCEAAEDLLAHGIACRPGRYAVTLTDIAGDDALLERYGVRIPVLREAASGAELGWPFDAATLLDFLHRLN